MTNTIEQLWNGTLEPVRYLGKNNPEIKQLEILLQRNLKNLEENLNEKLEGLLQKYYDCINEYLALTNEQAFYEGFCLGTKITVESLTGAEQIL